MKTIATICARGGSKGVPGKNIRLLAGIPLIAHSINHALESGVFSAVAVSSDAEEILEVAQQYGATHLVRRPANLASDSAAKIPAIRHCVESVQHSVGLVDVIVDLDATSPLRAVADIHGCLELLHHSGCPNVVTASPSRRSPYFNMLELSDEQHVRLVKTLPVGIRRRQDAPRTFDMNASIYVWRRDALFASDDVIRPETRLFVMPDARSLDIDSELDFDLVEFLISRRKS